MKSSRSILSIFSLGAILLSAITCQKSGPVEPNGSLLSIVPLVVGNTWNFHGISYDTLGSVREHFGEIHGVTKDTLLFGRQMTVYDGYCCQYTDSGIIFYAGYAINSQHPLDTLVSYAMLYKYPTFQGDVFGSVTVGTTDTVINVPAGSFHCINYQGFGYDMHTLYWQTYVAPGYGPVKYVSYFGNYCWHNPSQLQSYTELTTYSLK